MAEAKSLARVQPSEQAGAQRAGITPELVRLVADKVYALWLRDLRVEKERERRPSNGWCARG